MFLIVLSIIFLAVYFVLSRKEQHPSLNKFSQYFKLASIGLAIVGILTSCFVQVNGGFVALDGWSYFQKGMDVSNAPEVWIQDLRRYILPGILWVLGGWGFAASAYGIWFSKKWAIQAGLYSGAAIVAGWILLKLISLGFGNPPEQLGLYVGMPALYLLTQDARDYCSD